MRPATCTIKNSRNSPPRRENNRHTHIPTYSRSRQLHETCFIPYMNHLKQCVLMPSNTARKTRSNTGQNPGIRVRGCCNVLRDRRHAERKILRSGKESQVVNNNIQVTSLLWVIATPPTKTSELQTKCVRIAGAILGPDGLVACDPDAVLDFLSPRWRKS